MGVFTNHLMVDTAPEDVAGCAQILDIEMSLLRKLTDPSRQSLVMNLDVHESVMRAAKEAAKDVPMVTYSLRNQSAMVWLQSVSSTIWETELQVCVCLLGSMMMVWLQTVSSTIWRKDT